MIFYRVDITTSKYMHVIVWRGSRAAANQTAREMLLSLNEDYQPKALIAVIDVPTDKAGLMRWLNRESVCPDNPAVTDRVRNESQYSLDNLPPAQKADEDAEAA